MLHWTQYLTASPSCSILIRLQNTITWMNAVGQTQKLKTDLSYALFPKICFSSRTYFWNHGPICQSPTTKISGLFFSSFFTHIYHVSHQVLVFPAVISLSPIPIWEGVPPFTAVTGAPILLKDDLQLSTTFTFLCSNLTAAIWYPSWGLVLEFWLFNYLSLDDILVRLVAWFSNVCSLCRRNKD